MSVQEYKFKFSANTSDLERAAAKLASMQADYDKLSNRDLRVRLDLDTEDGKVKFKDFQDFINEKKLKVELEYSTDVKSLNDIKRNKDIAKKLQADIIQKNSNGDYKRFTLLSPSEMVANVNKRFEEYLKELEGALFNNDFVEFASKYKEMQTYLGMAQTKKGFGVSFNNDLISRYNSLMSNVPIDMTESLGSGYDNFTRMIGSKITKNIIDSIIRDFGDQFTSDTVKGLENLYKKREDEFRKEYLKGATYLDEDKTHAFYNMTGQEQRKKRGYNYNRLTDIEKAQIDAAADLTKLSNALQKSNFGITSPDSGLPEEKVFDILIQKAEHYKAVMNEIGRLQSQKTGVAANDSALDRKIAILARVAQMERMTFGNTMHNYNLEDNVIRERLGSDNVRILDSLTNHDYIGKNNLGEEIGIGSFLKGYVGELQKAITSLSISFLKNRLGSDNINKSDVDKNKALTNTIFNRSQDMQSIMNEVPKEFRLKAEEQITAEKERQLQIEEDMKALGEQRRLEEDELEDSIDLLQRRKAEQQRIAQEEQRQREEERRRREDDDALFEEEEAKRQEEEYHRGISEQNRLREEMRRKAKQKQEEQRQQEEQRRQEEQREQPQQQTSDANQELSDTAAQTTENLGAENDKMLETQNAANAAAEAKRKMAEANRDLASSADDTDDKVGKENKTISETKTSTNPSVNSLVGQLNKLAKNNEYKNLFIEDAETFDSKTGKSKLTAAQSNTLQMYDRIRENIFDSLYDMLDDPNVSEDDKGILKQAISDFQNQFESHIEAYIKSKIDSVTKALDSRDASNKQSGKIESAQKAVREARKSVDRVTTSVYSPTSDNTRALRDNLKEIATTERNVANLPKATKQYAKSSDVKNLINDIDTALSKIKNVKELSTTKETLEQIRKTLIDGKSAAKGFGDEFSKIKTDKFNTLLSQVKEANKTISKNSAPQKEVVNDLKELQKGRSDYFGAIDKQLSLSDGKTLQGIEGTVLRDYEASLDRIREKVRQINEQWGEDSDQAKEATEALRAYEERSANDSIKYLQKRMEAAEKSMAAVEKQNSYLGRDMTTEAETSFKYSRDKLAELNEKMASGYKNGDWMTSGFPEAVRDMQAIEHSIDAITGRKNAASMATTAEVDSLLNKVNMDLAKYNISDDVKSKLLGLQEVLQASRGDANALGNSMSELSKVKLSDLQAQFTSLDSQILKTSLIGKNLGQEIGDAMHTQFVQLSAQYLSLRQVIEYVKQMAQTVITLNTNLKELQKVSGESDQRISQSFRNASETAQQLGATISDVVNSTADWSRLGYDIGDAEELARVTTMYQNIAQGIDQSSASEYLVSVLQGFQLQANQAESVIDKINEVAQNFAINQAGEYARGYSNIVL